MNPLDMELTQSETKIRNLSRLRGYLADTLTEFVNADDANSATPSEFIWALEVEIAALHDHYACNHNIYNDLLHKVRKIND